MIPTDDEPTVVVKKGLIDVQTKFASMGLCSFCGQFISAYGKDAEQSIENLEETMTYHKCGAS